MKSPHSLVKSYIQFGKVTLNLEKPHWIWKNPCSFWKRIHSLVNANIIWEGLFFEKIDIHFGNSQSTWKVHIHLEITLNLKKVILNLNKIDIHFKNVTFNLKSPHSLGKSYIQFGQSHTEFGKGLIHFEKNRYSLWKSHIQFEKDTFTFKSQYSFGKVLVRFQKIYFYFGKSHLILKSPHSLGKC